MVVGGAGESLTAQSPDRDGTDLLWVSPGTVESMVLLVSLCFLQDKTGPSGVDSRVGLG